jgi:hypothetical protein
VHNAEFFFNVITLSGDELLCQLIHVITCYELSGVRSLLSAQMQTETMHDCSNFYEEENNSRVEAG